VCVFDEGFETGEGVVPLGRDAVEVVAKFEDRLRVEFEEGVAAGAYRADDFGALEDAEVLGDGLASEVRAVSELRDGTRLVATKPREQRETGGVGQGGEGSGLNSWTRFDYRSTRSARPGSGMRGMERLAPLKGSTADSAPLNWCGFTGSA
jgi:hypothetical protein